LVFDIRQLELVSVTSPLEAALKELRSEEAATEKRLATIRKAKQALEALSPDRNGQVKQVGKAKARRKVKPHNTLGPRGIEAAETILKENGGAMTVREIVSEIQRRGWIRENARAPMEATRVALRRLQGRGGAQKLADGRWIASPDGSGL
jgi:hypothetical protein